MQLDTVLETLRHKLLQLDVDRITNERRGWHETACAILAETEGVAYAIGVVEAAMQTPTFDRTIVWFRPSVTGNPAWDTVQCIPDTSDSFEQACRVTASLQDAYPDYVITLVES